MKYLFILLFCFILPAFGQETIEATFISKEKSNLEHPVGIDNFGNIYYFQGNTISINRKTDTDLTYTNVQLGDISSVDAFNRLKVNVFYSNFNTVVILDNRLNEIYKLNFNEILPYRNVTYVSTGNDNTIWIYNQDTQQLEVFDYKQRVSRVKTLPISSNVLDIASNYNFSWILTEESLISYNYFGSMVSKIKNDGYTSLFEINENTILKKENELFFLNGERNEITPIILPELLIKAFFATDETLYIYDGEFLHQYQLKIT